MVDWKIFRECIVEVAGEDLVKIIEKSFEKKQKEINPSEIPAILYKNEKISRETKEFLDETYQTLKEEEEARTILPGKKSTRARTGLPELKKFKLIDIIGQGGMGKVYTGIDTDLGRPIAIKEISSEKAKDYQKKRFQREILLTAKLDFEHRVIRARAVDTDNKGNTYFIMDFVEGEELTKHVDNTGRGRKYSLENNLELLADALDAISVVHEQGIVHRDIKPDNLMIDRKNIKIMDFGLAKEIGTEDIEGEPSDLESKEIGRTATYPNLTQDGTIMGTPKYMSPEQAINSKTVDERADIYSFGAILYEMLTGKTPNQGKSVRHLLATLVNQNKKPIAPSKTKNSNLDSIPAELEAICLKAIEKEPEKRYQKAKYFHDDIKAFLKGGDVKAYKYPAWKKAQRFIQRHPTGTLGTFLSAMILAGGAFGIQSYNAASLKAEAAKARAETAEKEKELEKARAQVLEIRAKTAETELKGQSESLNKLQSLEHLAQNENYYTAALNVINQAIQESEQFWKPYLVRAKHQATFGHQENAEQDFEKAQKLYKKQHKKESVEIWFEAGMFYGLPIEIGGKGEENKALEYFEKAAKKEGAFGELSEAVALMLKARQEQKRIDQYVTEAIKSIDQLKKDPIASNIDATWLVDAWIHGITVFDKLSEQKKDTLLKLKKYQDLHKAKHSLLKVVDKNSGNIAIRNFLGTIYSDLWQLEQAEEIYNHIIKTAPFPKYYANRARIYVRQGNLEKALNEYNKAINLSTDNAAAYYSNRSAIYAALGNYQKASADADKAISLEPDFGLHYYRKARLFYIKKDYEIALSFLNQAVNKSPQFSPSRVLRGEIYAHQGNFELARREYSSAIEANPFDWQAYFMLGNLSIAEHKKEEGISNFKKAAHHAPPPYKEGILNKISNLTNK